jgi:soluble lytic murein transglycosylase-like protein
MYADEWLDEFYEDELIEQEYPELIDDQEYSAVFPTPDHRLIARVIIILCLVLIGTLTHLTKVIFNAYASSLAVSQTANMVTNNEVDASTNNQEQSTNETRNWSGTCQVSPRYPAKVTQWCDLITDYATKHNLDPDLIAALVWLESGGNELAYSRSGAVGLMQVMPRDGLAASFMCVNGPCFKDRPTTNELRDPEFNIAYGTRFLAGLIQKRGNLREALKSYGPMDAGYTYSDKVLSIFNRYKSD